MFCCLNVSKNSVSNAQGGNHKIRFPWELAADLLSALWGSHAPTRLPPRIFSTNWPWELFWPREASMPAHQAAINRRHLWVDVKSDLRAPARSVATEELTFV